MNPDRISLPDFVCRVQNDHPKVFEQIVHLTIYDGAVLMCKQLAMEPPTGNENVQEHLLEIIDQLDMASYMEHIGIIVVD